MATVKKRMIGQRKEPAAQRLFICGIDNRWCQVRESVVVPKVHTTRTKIKGKVGEPYIAADGSLRRRQTLQEAEITCHVFTGGKALATVNYRNLFRLGLNPRTGRAVEVPAALVARVRKGCEYEQSLLEGE